MLDVTELTKYYGMRPVLRNISFHVDHGEFLAIVGLNGAGKTTLLRIIATLIRPDMGKITIHGTNALENPVVARRFIGVVSHQPLVYPDLTAVENLQFYARMYGVLPRGSTGASERFLNEALQRVDLLQRSREPVRTYSRGMLQRLSIARAVLHDPPLLLLDEPYTGLDQRSAQYLSELLHRLALAGRTVIMATHEYGRGIEGVTRVLMLQSGKVNADIHSDITEQHIHTLFT